MRYYIGAVSATVAIIIVVTLIWVKWGINLIDFTTALSVGLVLSVPAIVAWSIRKEREQKPKKKKSKVNYTNLTEEQKDKIVNELQKRQEQKEIEKLEKGESSDPKRQKENEDRNTPTGFK